MDEKRIQKWGLSYDSFSDDELFALMKEALETRTQITLNILNSPRMMDVFKDMKMPLPNDAVRVLSHAAVSKAMHLITQKEEKLCDAARIEGFFSAFIEEQSASYKEVSLTSDRANWLEHAQATQHEPCDILMLNGSSLACWAFLQSYKDLLGVSVVIMPQKPLSVRP